MRFVSCSFASFSLSSTENECAGVMVLGFTGFSGSLSFVVVSPEEILSARDFSGITAICVSLSPMESVSDRV